jgi:sulfur carrier protein ThiS
MVTVYINMGENQETMELPPGSSTDSLMEKLLPEWDHNVLVVVNGKVAKPGQPLYSSDRVVVLPLMSGG